MQILYAGAYSACGLARRIWAVPCLHPETASSRAQPPTVQVTCIEDGWMTDGRTDGWIHWRCQRFSSDCFGAVNWCQLVPSLLEGSGVLLTFICHLRQGHWRLFSRRHAALQSKEPQQNENRRQQATRKRKCSRTRSRARSSPWFVRRWWCPSGGPAGTSGCSAASRSVARRMVEATKHQTSETQVTGWSAGLKQEHSRHRCELLQVSDSCWFVNFKLVKSVVKYEDGFLLMDTYIPG